MTGPVPVLLRPGGLSREQIEEVVGTVESISLVSVEASPQLGPGLLATHYATRTPLVLAKSEDQVPDALRVGLLGFQPESSLQPFAAVEILSSRGDLAEAAANLFAAMRRLDALNLDLIVARPVPEIGLGRAINDRLRRAASRSNH